MGQVDIVEFSNRALRQFNAEQVKDLVQQMEKRGIRFYFNAGVKVITKTVNHYIIETTDGNKIKSNYVIDYSGCKPNFDYLNLIVTRYQK